MEKNNLPKSLDVFWQFSYWIPASLGVRCSTSEATEIQTAGLQTFPRISPLTDLLSKEIIKAYFCDSILQMSSIKAIRFKQMDFSEIANRPQRRHLSAVPITPCPVILCRLIQNPLSLLLRKQRTCSVLLKIGIRNRCVQCITWVDGALRFDDTVMRAAGQKSSLLSHSLIR